jgi:virginiamycin B lyase
MPTFREHPIPSPGSRPYIFTFAPDGNLFVCESGAGKIGRLSLGDGAFVEFAIPTRESRPIGITVGGDGNLWFTENGGHKIGRITPEGAITEFPVPTPNAGPDGIGLGPDGNVWFAERDAGQVGRITPHGVVTEFSGFPSDARPLAPTIVGEEIWWSDPPGSRIFRMALDGRLTGCATARPGGGPRAMLPCSDGNVWFVLAESHAIGRIDRRSFAIAEFPLPRASSSPRSIIEADGDIWFTDAGANLIGRMSFAGKLIAEYPVPTPKAGLRAMKLHIDGRIFFSEFDAGAIGEMTVSGLTC